MRRKFWLTLALAAALAVGITASATALRRSPDTDPRPTSVTRGLDYFHSRQGLDGGFGSMSATLWVILGATASGERIGSSMWTIAGKNPFSSLEANDQQKAATGADSDNAPVYYSQAILAYVAAGQADRVFIAGTPHVDLLAQLYNYQDLLTGSPTYGSFSPALSNREFKAVSTTAWAILAMKSMGVTDTDRFKSAEAWLAKQQKDDGGFPVQAGQSSNCEVTAMAVQALKLAPDDTVGGDVFQAARQFLKDSQRPDGGFPVESGGKTDAWATAAGIQAILALGEKPDDSFWQTTASTPRAALTALQQKTGAYERQQGESSDELKTTGWALIALRDQPFTTYPATRPPALKSFVFRPRSISSSPRNGAKYTTTNTVLIRATYTDGAKGTGVNPKKCTVSVDGQDQTKPADIGTHLLHLTLNNVPNGTHTYKLQIVDFAGNIRTIENTFVVAKPTPIVPGPQPTYVPPPNPYPTTGTGTGTGTGSGSGSGSGTGTVTPYPTLTPGPIYTPTDQPTAEPGPYESGYPVSGTPVASPDTTGTMESSVTVGGGSGGSGSVGTGGQGSAAGYAGGILLAMLPLGALASYLVVRRREDALGAASEGAVLAGGGSSWDRLRLRSASFKNAFKPAGRV